MFVGCIKLNKGQTHSGAINMKTHSETLYGAESDSASDQFSKCSESCWPGSSMYEKKGDSSIHPISLSLYTYLYKIKARQQRHAVFGRFLLGLVFGGRHLGVGPVTACWGNRLQRHVREEFQSAFRDFPLSIMFLKASKKRCWNCCQALTLLMNET